ncbi:glucose-6-phosphate 1-dehydrogenase [Liquorilactobacillus sucicola DSM 21376 = JCM 15457]|uniref:Glucose-6-phosphate 1-dehydrogenase n=1 Tax=Liquorilactobacillus sucicola DSM 21376 = JCM 15457 TaxID=1423806 RepID=A0A023CVY4_9LACO|nr:glucose-6-phosphate dehydrogenase [Liquorilactobacillus sucicola]KRN06057.1 glucose-6-phosphate 1-dehydrogenase [Liquorilactobacillus sucicola DSM 21376 = JCM 15457]GAJ25984.1 glucose-6-phosphate 1-dehydrogenase [Liquorilactobacillus sucicola DSM 21376 = JCM 15457]
MGTRQQALFIIFGGTGDLAKRKLYPSLFELYKKGFLKENFAVIGTARRPWTDEYFQDVVRKAVTDADTSKEDADEFAQHFYYQSHNVNDTEHYVTLRKLAQRLDQKYSIGGNRLFYLAMSPRFFGTIAEHLKSQNIVTDNGYNRLIIEKPFGHDLASAKDLNNSIGRYFAEDSVFRIDHYLGKEMIQNIAAVRFGNNLFRSLWNNRYIDNIQITLSEALGVEERAGYYETAGALRDMVQNHILQIVSLLTMNMPASFTESDIRREKIYALKALQVYSPEQVEKNFVRAQYGESSAGLKGYRQEEQIADDSKTETFVAGKVFVNSENFSGVPIYIRTGKRLSKKTTRIDIVFKDVPKNIFGSERLGKNILTIIVEPKGEIYLQMNVKKIGQNFGLKVQKLDLLQVEDNSVQIPEAYEKLILDVLRGDATNFTHWEEVAYSWKFVDAIRNAWDNQQIPLPEYASGSMGPQEADDLLARDDHHWIFTSENDNRD